MCMGIWNATFPTSLNTGILIIGFFLSISVLWNTIWDTQFLFIFDYLLCLLKIYILLCVLWKRSGLISKIPLCSSFHLARCLHAPSHTHTHTHTYTKGLWFSLESVAICSILLIDL